MLEALEYSSLKLEDDIRTTMLQTRRNGTGTSIVCSKSGGEENESESGQK
jgi:hypothetical protein